MGKIFLEHMGGRQLYNCARCKANLTNHNELISKGHATVTGQAYLFGKVVNVTFGNLEHRGASIHLQQVREVFCKNCNVKLGFVYEYVKNEEIRYLEGKTVLDVAMIVLERGLDNEI